MSVVIETTLGDITVDLFLEQRPVTCLNFLKLCKMKYYNYNLFHSIRSGFIAQTGDPTGEGSGGESIFGLLEGPEKRFFSGEKMPKIRHIDTGMLSMVGTGDMMIGSQFFFTLGSDLDSLDGHHCVIGEVTEGHEVLRKLNEVICDETHRPYQDVRITHTVILEDPYTDPTGFRAPSRSPSPSAERLRGGRIAPDEELDDTQGKSAQEIQEMIEEKEAKARATILEMVGDLPDADIAPPENVLFVCKLNPVTTDEDLEIIFSRFGKIVSCEVIRDKKTGDSLQYAFIEFSDKQSCEDAYFKMDNVLIDDRRIHVDFSQSVSKIKWLGKGRGVKHLTDEDVRKEKFEDKNKKLQPRSKEQDRGRDGKIINDCDENGESEDNRKKHRGEIYDRNKNKDERNRGRDQKGNNTDNSEKHRNEKDKVKLDKDRKVYQERNRDERNDRNKDEKGRTREDRNRKDYKERNRDDQNRTKRIRNEENPTESTRDIEQIVENRNKNVTRGKGRDRDDNIRKNKVNNGKEDQQSMHARGRSPVHSRTDRHDRQQNREFDSANKSQGENCARDRKREERDRDRQHRAEKEATQNKHRERSRSRENSRERIRKESNHQSYLGDSSDDVKHTKNRTKKYHSVDQKYDDKKLNYNSHKSSKDKESARLESRNNSQISDNNEKDAGTKRSRKEEKENRDSKRKRKEETHEENSDKKKSKFEKSAKKKRLNEKKLEKKTKTRKKRRKDSTSSSDSESSSSTSSSSSSTSSSSDSDRRKKRVRRRKRKYSSTSSSSSSSTSSSSDSSSDSSSSSSDSDAKKKKTKNSKKRLVKKTKKK